MAIRFPGLRNLILSQCYRWPRQCWCLPFVGLSKSIWNASKRVWINRVVRYDSVKIYRVFWRDLHFGEFKVNQVRGFLTDENEDSRHPDVDTGDVFTISLQLPLQRCFHTVAWRLHVLPLLLPVSSLRQGRGLEHSRRKFHFTGSSADDATRNRNCVSNFLDYSHPACCELVAGRVLSVYVGWVWE